MGTYAVTGSTSGMGKAAADKLRAAGHSVIGVDVQEADVVADLATPQGRRTAAREVLEATGGRLDGAVLAAGMGPTAGPGRLPMIAQVNYFGVVELLEAWQPALAAAHKAKVVVFSSNSTSTTPLVPRRAVKALLDSAPQRAVRAVRFSGKLAPTMIYAASKTALSHWVRHRAVRSDWAGAGIRLNALAPGAIRTPLLERQLAGTAQSTVVKSYPLPIGEFGNASHIGDWVLFMLSDAADFQVGSIVYVDGGSDAYFRPESWPQPVRLPGLAAYLGRMVSFAARRFRSRHNRTKSK
jgi:NAD(P)-dependent dehydrogenase (short-subunit alcohol dehydrogenase family)